MSFEKDLETIIRRNLDQAEVHYDAGMRLDDLVARYIEMATRRVAPKPRRVLFSEEFHESLGKLFNERSVEQRQKALEAWRAVFLLRHLLQNGENVVRFLSRKIDQLTIKDGLLWDFGMHHFHLSTQTDETGFVIRSDYLLFAIITQEVAYLVDVRLHRDPESLGWVRQDLLKIVHSNWPEVLDGHELKGVLGTEITDKQRKEIRRKSANAASVLGNKTIYSIGGGTMANGSSTLCRVYAMKLLHEIRRHQSYFDDRPSEVLSAFRWKGKELNGEVNFELVALEEINASDSLVKALEREQCMSKELWQIGFVIVEATTRIPIIISVTQ